jgi:DNA invertase Pin-like site-specific DNA recombinase
MKRPQTRAAPPEVKRCAIYTRKSTSAGLEQEFNSLDAQYEACANFVRMQPTWRLVDDRYDDGGFTGANIDRPGFQRLLADVDAKLIDVIVVYKVDRLSRSLLDFAKVMERLNSVGASFVSVTQNFSTADAMGRLTLNMLMSFAEFEREMIADRTRDKVAAARKKGKWTGGHVPFGYTSHEKKLVINELDARVVREAFDLLLQHRSAAAVARVLNEREHWPAGSKLPNGKPPRWTNDSIARVLRNHIYAGLISSGESLNRAEHPAIVNEETYHRVQAILDGVGRELNFSGLNHDYVLRGLLRCSLCGAAMTPASARKGKTLYRYYRCSTRNKAGKSACTAAPVSAQLIEEHVTSQLAEAVATSGLAEDTARALDAKLRHKREALSFAQARLPSHIAALSSSTDKLAVELTSLKGKARDVIQAKLEVEADKLEAAERELAAARKELASLEAIEADVKWVIRALQDFERVWDVLNAQNRGRLLRALLDRVIVDAGSGQVSIHFVDINVAAEPAIQEAA